MLKNIKSIGQFGFWFRYWTQTMTEAEHNRPIPKFFGDRPSSAADEVFGKTIGLIVSKKCSAAEAEGRLPKSFGFGRLCSASVIVWVPHSE